MPCSNAGQQKGWHIVPALLLHPTLPVRLLREPFSPCHGRIRQVRLELSLKFLRNALEVLDVTANDEGSAAHVVSYVVERAIVHPSVDGGASDAQLLRGVADADELVRLVGTVLGKREHSAQIRIPEGAGNRIVLGRGRPEQELQDGIDRVQYLFLRFANLAPCQTCQSKK